jgi:hypothetical protein
LFLAERTFAISRCGPSKNCVTLALSSGVFRVAAIACSIAPTLSTAQKKQLRMPQGERSGPRMTYADFSCVPLAARVKDLDRVRRPAWFGRQGRCKHERDIVEFTQNLILPRNPVNSRLNSAGFSTITKWPVPAIWTTSRFGEVSFVALPGSGVVLA